MPWRPPMPWPAWPPPAPYLAPNLRGCDGACLCHGLRGGHGLRGERRPLACVGPKARDGLMAGNATTAREDAAAHEDPDLMAGGPAEAKLVLAAGRPATLAASGRRRMRRTAFEEPEIYHLYAGGPQRLLSSATAPTEATEVPLSFARRPCLLAHRTCARSSLYCCTMQFRRARCALAHGTECCPLHLV